MGWRKGTENSTEMQAAWQQGSSVGERPCGKGMHPHSRRAQPTHFFPLPFHQRNTESGQGFERKKPHSEAAQDFFRSELAKPLTASECGVTFADRKRKNHLQALSTQR